MAHGVVVFPGRAWFAGDPPAPHVRMTFAAAPAATLEAGVAKLSEM